MASDSSSDSPDAYAELDGAVIDTPPASAESVRKVIHLAQKSHICHFYANRRDMVEILVPFFKEGLEKGDFCLWGAALPLPPEQAREALGKAVRDLDYYISTKQLVIFPVSD